MFEVNTDLQKNVQAKITAQLIWPSLINSTRHVTFPLTNTNSSAVSAPTMRLLCARKRLQECLEVLLKLSSTLRASSGKRDNAAKSSRRSRVRPSAPAGAAAQPVDLLRKVVRQVGSHSQSLASSQFVDVHRLQACSACFIDPNCYWSAFHS